jgi:hypothetical protein
VLPPRKTDTSAGPLAAWYMIGDLATEQVPFWAAHWLADGMDGDALRTLAGLDRSDSPTVWEILPGALADTHTPIPRNVPDAVDQLDDLF